MRVHLFALLFLGIASTVYFFYGDAFPDNYFSIQSGNHSINILSYYFSSFVASLAYYAGLWIGFSFLLYLFIYAFLARRDFIFDSLVPLLLLVSCLMLFSFFAPHFIGAGLLDVINFFTPSEQAIIFFTSLIMLALVLTRFSKAPFIWVGRKLISYGLLTAAILKKWYRHKKLSKDLSPSIPARAIDFQQTEVKAESALSTTPLFKSDGRDNFESFKNDSEKEIQSEQNLKQEIENTQTHSTKPILLAGDHARNEAQFKSDELVASISHNKTHRKNSHPDDAYFKSMIAQIEDKLKEFKIDAHIINIMKGPVVDTFELELGSGVKVSRVISITEDLSLALCGVPLRMVYPIQGKNTMGIEVPRSPREIIYLDEVLSSPAFSKTDCLLPICMGKDAYGDPFVVDLASMPHMLIAGATGAGKSVFINTLLVSLLVKRSPSQMKLLLIDPKQLELALYAELPHLCLPVITDGKTAAVSLIWACQEMERRYSILREMGVRNIASFNQKIKMSSPEQLSKLNKFYEGYEEKGYELPYIVIIIDEFADLILTKAGKEIENNICRLAAKARASGIHLVIATQRPSVDVITGLIKSNFPTRVSFKVTSSIDSRTILGTQGSEKLLGRGDMLYSQSTELIRCHSAYIDEVEIETLMGRLKKMKLDYDHKALEFLESEDEQSWDQYTFTPNGSSPETESLSGELYQQAIQIIVEHKKASASFLQRRLGIGYNRAANLIEKMEADGIVGPQQGSKPRDILLGKPV
jgi:S-DNA-T family DNA segregation ATPase FtsK/SpoIIIE